MNQMTSIELGGDAHGQVQPTHRLVRTRRIGHRTNEVAPRPMKTLALPASIASIDSTTW